MEEHRLGADQAGRRVAALEQRLARESDLFLRNSLYELLAQQQRAGLVVAADEAVAARLVSAPAAETRPSLPNRPLLLGPGAGARSAAPPWQSKSGAVTMDW